MIESVVGRRGRDRDREGDGEESQNRPRARKPTPPPHHGADASLTNPVLSPQSPPPIQPAASRRNRSRLSQQSREFNPALVYRLSRCPLSTGSAPQCFAG